MASYQMQKPAEQTCNQKSHEQPFGQKATEMTHHVFKSCTEYIHHQGHQGQKAGHPVAPAQSHCTSQAQGRHGKDGKSLKEKIAEKKEKVKGLFKKKNQNCRCDDKKKSSSSSSSSSSESESESDNDACPKKN